MKDALKISGSYVIRKYKEGDIKYKTVNGKVVVDKDSLKRAVPIFVSAPIPNRIVVGVGYGKNIIMRQLIGDTTYPIEIDSASIGTGTATPADSDTGLGTSVTSGIVVADSSLLSNSVAEISFFIPSASLANGTYTEFGIFANLRLFARSLITPTFTKASNQDTTFTYTLTQN